MRCMYHLRAARESGLLSTVQVQGGKNGVFDVGILLDYIYLYILLLCYIAIYLYIYIVIVLFVYCFIACLQHGGIAFFISIFYFCSLLRPLFSPNVGTTQTDILYSVTSKKQPLISDTFFISKQINDAEAKPLSLPPSASGSL